MTRIAAVMRRELGAYFHSPIAAVVLAVFFVVCGYFFHSDVGYYSLVSMETLQKATPDPAVNLIEGIVRPYFTKVAVVLLVFLPMLTMRLFSDELRSGTFELLLSYPVRDRDVVLGKFLAAFLFLALLLVGVILDALLLGAVVRMELAPLATAFLGLLLMGSAFLALGTFASTLTSNQIIAAVLAFGALVTFVVLEWVAQLSSPATSSLLGHLSILGHFGDFAKGVVDAQDVVYYVGFAAFFLCAAARSIEMRRTRGF